MTEKKDRRMPEMKIIDRQTIMDKRLEIMMKYQTLALEATRKPGPNQIQHTFEFVSFTELDSSSIIEAVNDGNINALAYMAVEFELFVKVHGREDLINKAPLSVSPQELKIR